jgi:hypothetical protein
MQNTNHRGGTACAIKKNNEPVLSVLVVNLIAPYVLSG